ncbi:uncharacterized protein BP5553_02305 [Venustampulla echinocandica]|uniref:AMP-dependent synthetase/ligase domain-containing protein n=1 Tax=Venustampulla echinocandica TaxID=2656787 RepID=A0A370U3G9_9HELO|nr:uncharacterized protein BP5553_02305 [Venustampulla echinocandica]RDL42326.1 hypothetical protein BP5553_02305 [Venustampulla echinocandica]
MTTLPSESKIGRRLLPVVIDEISTYDPSRIFATIPISESLRDGFMDVTYRDFANAINRMSAWFDHEFGGKSSSFETVSYNGPPDLGYSIMTLAACKMGFKTILSSFQNKLEDQLNLLKKAECKAMIFAEGHPINPDQIDKHGIPIVRVPTLKEMLDIGGPEPVAYTFTKTYDEAEMDPLVLLTTSGTTSVPKLVVVRHGWVSAVDRAHSVPKSNGRAPSFTVFKNRRLWSPLPAFHGGGLIGNLIIPTFSNTHSIWAPSGRPLSTTLVEEMIDHIHFDMVLLTPFIIEVVVKSDYSRSKLEKVDFVVYGGVNNTCRKAPLPRETGNRIWQKTKLINMIGSTELSVLPTYLKDPEDWEYFYYSPDLPGIQMRPTDGDPDLYEQVIVRDPATDPYHSTFWTFPDAEEYRVNDLYAKHPSKPNLWLYIGRADDLIVLSDGKSFNPTSMEAVLRQHNYVEAAVIIGQGKLAPAAIIQFKRQVFEELGPEYNRDSFMKDIWPCAVAANKIAPPYAHMSEDMFFLANAEKPFRFTAKGSMMRHKTIALYAQEIEDWYSVADGKASIAKL